MTRLTQIRVKELFDYDGETGVLTWRMSRSGIKTSKIAGSDLEGYRRTEVDGTNYLNHRLIWLWVFGYMPENNLDHINRCRSDNRIKNLREVSNSCNLRNTGNRKDNTSGVKGVCWETREKKWRAQVRVNQQTVFLGYYSDFNDAVCARLAGEQSLGWAGCDDSSPAFQYVRDNIQMLYKKEKRHANTSRI